MAEQTTNPEEQALRRRARRRLVGSLALALLAVVVLPMIFEPEPKPLGR
jgi:DedD protein